MHNRRRVVRVNGMTSPDTIPSVSFTCKILSHRIVHRDIKVRTTVFQIDATRGIGKDRQKVYFEW